MCSKAFSIDKVFVSHWGDVFESSRKKTQADEERAILSWLANQSSPKCLNKEYFVRIGRWKTPRYNTTRKSIPESKIQSVINQVHACEGDSCKMLSVTSLPGVGLAVGSALLYFLDPKSYPLFDYHVCNTLYDLGYWEYDASHFTLSVWLVYIDLTRRLANDLGVELRSLEKALLAFDKYPE